MTIRAGRPAKCHPEKNEVARGLCVGCYARRRRRVGPRATCHPKRVRKTGDGLCQVCADARRYSSESAKAWRDRRRFAARCAQYGITVADYERMFEAQAGACAICRRSQAKATRTKALLCIDHCHDGKRVRGLLCDPCNRGLGLFRESVSAVQAAVNYLAGRGGRP